jgi:hypothetical protein
LATAAAASVDAAAAVALLLVFMTLGRAGKKKRASGRNREGASRCDERFER